MAREVIALLLAGVLLVAGGAKLFDPAGTRRSVRELGLPTAFGWPAAITLPLVELVLAAGLVVEATSRAAAAAAAGLLAVFAVVIGINAVRGRRVDCGCFGPLHSSKTGYSTVLRNAGLALLAVVVAATPAAPIRWLELGAGLGVAALAAQAALWVVLLRRYGGALRRIDELEAVPHEESVDVGSPPPWFALPTVDGDELSLDELLAPGKPLLLVFTDTGCGACTALLPDVVRWQHGQADRLTLAVIGHGDADRLRAAAEEHGLGRLLLAPDRSLALSYGSYGVPSAVLVVDGRVARPVVYGVDEIASLLEPSDAEPATEELTHA